MAKHRLASKGKAGGVKQPHEVTDDDAVTREGVRWSPSEIWEKPWIDVDALIARRLDTLRDQDRRITDQESEYAETNKLSIEFSSEFNRICKLMQDVTTDELLTKAEVIELNLSEIVYRHRNRHSRDRGYFQRIRGGVQSAEIAADHIDKLVGVLMKLDDVHRDTFMFTVNKLSLGRFGEMVGDFARPILEAQLMMQLFSKALQLSTLEPFEQQGRGRPRVKYVPAAYDLVDLWERLTGQKAVYPKGSAKGKGGLYEAVQPSSEFIRLALQMIDPDITNAQAITCLKYVFSINKSRKDDPYTRDHLIPPPIMDAILAGGSASDVEEAFLKYEKEIANRINRG
jgi:hypothetical protein